MLCIAARVFAERADWKHGRCIGRLGMEISCRMFDDAHKGSGVRLGVNRSISRTWFATRCQTDN